MEQNTPNAHAGSFSLRSFLKSLLGYSMASWMQAVVAFISIPIVTRIFSPDQYGKINMLMLAVTIGTLFLRLSTEQSYIRFFLEREETARKRFLTLCITINLTMFVLLFGVLLVFYKPLSIQLIGEVNARVLLIYLPIITLCTALGEYQRVYFKMKNLLKLYFVFTVLAIFANKLSMLCAAFTTPDYSHAMAYMAVSFFVGFLLIWAICPACFSLKRPALDKAELITIFRYALPFLPAALLIYLNNAVSSFVLKASFDYGTLAIYSATVSITNIMAIFQSGFAIYWGPFVYQNYKTQQGVIQKIHSWLSFVMAFIVLGMILIANLLFYILGPEYRAGSAIFGLLLLPHILTTIAETTCYGIYLAKKTYLQIYCTVLSVTGNILVSFLLIPRLGLLGAALANALGAILSFAARTYFGQREYKSTQNFWRTVLALSLVFVGGLVSYGLTDHILLKDLSVSILLICLCALYREDLVALLRQGKQFLKSKKIHD